MSKTQYIQADIDRFLDDFLSDSKHDSTTRSRRDDFSSQWYDYEEEYAYNLY